MKDGRQDQLAGFVIGLLLGAAIGATAAFLTAPEAGRKTRKRIGKAAMEIRKGTGDRWEELADDVKGRVDDALSGARKRLANR